MPSLSSKSRLYALIVAAALATSAMPARQAMAQSVSVEAMSFGSPAIMLRIPKIEIEGSSLSQSEVTQLLGTRDAKSFSAMLAKLNAKSIRVPEMRIEQKIPAGDGTEVSNTTIYRDFVMTNVTAGKAQSVQIAGGTIENKGSKAGTLSGKIGKLTAEELDVGLSLRFYTDKATAGDNERKLLYRNMILDGMTFSGPDQSEFVLGRMTAGDARVRPMKESMAEFMAFLEANKDTKKMDSANVKRMIHMFAELFDAFETSPGAIDGFKFRGLDKNKKPVEASIDKITVGAFANRKYPAFAIDNMQVKAPDGSMKIAKAGWKETDLNPTLVALHAVGDSDFEKWATENWRQLIPAFGGMFFNGLDFDFPDTKNKGQRVRGKLGEFDVTLAKYLGGIPTDMSARIKNLAMDIPANTTEKGLKDLLDLGYKSINIGMGFSTQWDEASKNIKVNSLSLEGVDMGTISLGSTLGNAARELFTGDKNAMQLAALGLTVKDIKVNISNSGLFDRVYDREAKKGKKTPDQLKQEISGMAQALIPAFLGGSDAATAVGKAVAQFASKPKDLVINAKSKEPNGLTLLEAMMSSKNPMALLPKIDISASAN